MATSNKPCLHTSSLSNWLSPTPGREATMCVRFYRKYIGLLTGVDGLS
jgi:hypothetical protein